MLNLLLYITNKDIDFFNEHRLPKGSGFEKILLTMLTSHFLLNHLY